MTRIYRQRRAFTLLEIFVVLGIIAMFLALLVPFFLRMREGGRSAECVKNMRLIGKAILQYTTENEDRLPGPLSVDQYPVGSAGNPPRDGQLLKYITSHLQQPANSPEPGDARTIFTYPAWQRAEHTTDSPVFLINNEPVLPFAQPAWGAPGKPPLKLAQLREWVTSQGEKATPVDLSKTWALTEADQMLAGLIGIQAPWVARLSPKPVHVTQRFALYFDWSVGPLTLMRTVEAPAQ